MKRRPFLKTLAAGGAAISAGTAVTDCRRIDTGKQDYHDRFKTVPDYNRILLCSLDNDFLSLKLYSDASADIIDKKNNQSWKMIPVALQEEGEIEEGHVWLRTGRSFCEQYPGRFHGELQGDRIRFTLIGSLHRYIGQFTCEVRLEDQWITYRLTDIDSSIPSLIFPTPIESESLVFPIGIGRWIREPLVNRQFWPFFSRMNMRWFGGLQGTNGWLGVFGEGFCDGGVMADQMYASPGWWKSLGTWNRPRSIRYAFTSGGYVGLAKKYREYAMKNGLYVSIAEKIDRKPKLGNLVGGRSLSFWMSMPPADEMYYYNRWRSVPEDIDEYRNRIQVRITYRDASGMIGMAEKLGMKNGIAVYRGWIKNGYDGSHPDIWPPNEALGTMEELRDSMKQPDHIISALHDNYADIYESVPSFPAGVIRGRDGSLMRGGYWGGGQAYIIHAKHGLEYAKRNWEQIRTLGSDAIFTDTTTAVQVYQTWEKGNRLTRQQDLDYKTELLRFFNDKGQIVGSEEGADFGVPWCAWFECRQNRKQGETIPLWPLVFHDAVFNTRYTGNHLDPIGNSSEAPEFLTDMLWGYHLNYNFNSGDGMEKYKEDFVKTLPVDEWHRLIGTAEMLDHKFLTDDMMVEQTVFAPGYSIIVNFDSTTRYAGGRILQPHSYIIL